MSEIRLRDLVRYYSGLMVFSSDSQSEHEFADDSPAAVRIIKE
jgi:hypothetical protein